MASKGEEVLRGGTERRGREEEGTPNLEKSHWKQEVLLVIGLRGQERSLIFSHWNTFYYTLFRYTSKEKLNR